MDSLSIASTVSLQNESTPIEQSFQSIVHEIHRYEEEMQVLQKEIDMFGQMYFKNTTFIYTKIIFLFKNRKTSVIEKNYIKKWIV